MSMIIRYPHTLLHPNAGDGSKNRDVYCPAKFPIFRRAHIVVGMKNKNN